MNARERAIMLVVNARYEKARVHKSALMNARIFCYERAHLSYERKQFSYEHAHFSYERAHFSYEHAHFSYERAYEHAHFSYERAMNARAFITRGL